MNEQINEWVNEQHTQLNENNLINFPEDKSYIKYI